MHTYTHTPMSMNNANKILFLLHAKTFDLQITVHVKVSFEGTQLISRLKQ